MRSRVRLFLTVVIGAMVVITSTTALAIGVQAGIMERAASLPPISRERLATVSPAQLLDPAKCIGPANAPVAITVFADFFCPACRGALASLLEYQSRNRQAVHHGKVGRPA